VALTASWELDVYVVVNRPLASLSDRQDSSLWPAKHVMKPLPSRPARTLCFHQYLPWSRLRAQRCDLQFPVACQLPAGPAEEGFRFLCRRCSGRRASARADGAGPSDTVGCEFRSDGQKAKRPRVSLVVSGARRAGKQFVCPPGDWPRHPTERQVASGFRGSLAASQSGQRGHERALQLTYRRASQEVADLSRRGSRFEVFQRPAVCA